MEGFPINVYVIYAAIFTLFAGGFLIFIFFVNSKKKSKVKDIILIVGPSGGGKTVIAHKLCTKESPETIASMKPATLSYNAEGKSKPSTVVDFPGHPKARTLLTDYLTRAKKIVFVVDASNIQNQIREAAEYLYDIFTNPIMENGPAVLVACNKSDVTGVRPPARVKLALQQELEKIRKTRQSLEVVGDSDILPLGREGKEFVIERDAPVEISFLATSGKSGALDAIMEFIE